MTPPTLATSPQPAPRPQAATASPSGTRLSPLLLAMVGALALGCEGDPVKELGDGSTGPVTSPVDDDAADTVPDATYDLDHDGYTSDVDCNDNDWAIHPDAAELCDGKDNDCDSQVDEGWDVDGDDHLPIECEGGDDCDDSNPSIHPGATDVPYDGIDQDCDGVDDLDADDDGFDAIEAGGNDCDDTSPTVYPGAPEVAKDEIDQDCDGLDLLDGDGDGFDDQAWGGTDCDDNDALIFPNAWEWLNDEVDSDCDGTDGRPVDMSDADVIFSGGASSNDYFAFGITSCDLDNDGVDDLVFTAPLDGSGQEGAVGIFLSSSAGNWDTGGSIEDADVLIMGDDLGFGLGVACGDLDGDGRADLLASSGEYGPFDNDMRINVWYGASGWTAEMSQAESDAELTIDLGAGSGSTSVFSLGFGLGDLDDDGAADLMIIADAPEELEGLGDPDESVWLIPGGEWTGSQRAEDLVTARVSPDQNGIVTGVSVVDDWDGDGAPELVLQQGEYWSDLTGTEYTLGRVSFLSGWPATDDQAANLAFASLEGSSGNNTGFGYSVHFADFIEDGAIDMVGCAPYTPYSTRTNSGACYAYDDIASDVTATGLQATTYSDSAVVSGYQDGLFGAYTSLVDDVSGDGIPEILATEPGGGTGSRGRTLILSGAEVATAGGLPDDVAVAEFSHTNNYSAVSASRTTGDFDGDGVTDFVFGAYGYGRTSSSAGYYQGRAWVWLSSRYLAP